MEKLALHLNVIPLFKNKVSDFLEKNFPEMGLRVQVLGTFLFFFFFFLFFFYFFLLILFFEFWFFY